jgi:hypothetical protein
MKVFGVELAASKGIKVLYRDSSYLKFQSLNSFWFAEPREVLSSEPFQPILNKSLGSGHYEDIERHAFCIEFYVRGAYTSGASLSTRNVYGFSVFSYGHDGVRRSYFKKGRGSTYSHISKLDARLSTPFSSARMTLLHFASFPNPPKESGIFVLRTGLTKDQLSAARTWRRAARDADVPDEIYADADFNPGVAYLDNGPGPGNTCGFLCTTDLPLSACIGDITGRFWICKPVEGPSCVADQLPTALAADAPAGTIPEEATVIQLQNERVRAFRDSFLRKKSKARKYIGYYALFSKYAKRDRDSIRDYAEIMLDIHAALAVLRRGSGGEIVVTEQLFRRAMKIIDR